jgi:hypothetical protein
LWEQQGSSSPACFLVNTGKERASDRHPQGGILDQQHQLLEELQDNATFVRERKDAKRVQFSTNLFYLGAFPSPRAETGF